MRRLNRTLILSFICIIINISISCRQQDDNFLRGFKSVLFIIAQEKPLSLACLTIIQNEKMEIKMNSKMIPSITFKFAGKTLWCLSSMISFCQCLNTVINLFQYPSFSLSRYFMGILYQTESFLTACISLVYAWARQAVIETIAVVYELTKRT